MTLYYAISLSERQLISYGLVGFVAVILALTVFALIRAYSNAKNNVDASMPLPEYYKENEEALKEEVEEIEEEQEVSAFDLTNREDVFKKM